MENSKWPRITVVTPSYNQGKFLEETILSVINQDYPNLEYFIIDGGSTDNSIDIIKKYGDKIDWWVSEPDQGQSDAISKGFKRARGRILCWINSDDILLPEALDKIARAYTRRDDIDIFTGNTIYIDKNDFITRRCIKVPRMRWFFYKFGVGYFSAPAVFFKKELYEAVGGLDINLHLSMDIDLWHKFRLAKARVFHIKDYLGCFRVHTQSKTGSFRLKDKKAFENPETTIVRAKYIPNVSKNTIRMFRIIYKIWQVTNLNYFRSWLDFQKWKGKKWQDIFAKS